VRKKSAFAIFAIFVGGCSVYDSFSGEYSAGGVDPGTFAPPYLGAGAKYGKPGSGSFTELRAWSGGQPIGHYLFPLSTAQSGSGVDPFRLVDKGMPYAKVPVPNAYDLSAVPCNPPQNYVWDERTDEVRYDQQGVIFSALPTAVINPGALPTWSYVPIVTHVPVAGGPIDCQGIKSEQTLLSTPSLAVGPADGTYDAWAIVDGDAPVYRVGQSQSSSNGWGIQKLGWYKHYIVTYLDGGPVPTYSSNDGTVKVSFMNLYYPRSMVGTTANAFPGASGQGYDVVEAIRGQGPYSPVCQVFTYDAGMTLTADQLPKDAQTIRNMYGDTVQPDKPAYVYCLQVQ
jgi:hypothetical protein